MTSAGPLTTGRPEPGGTVTLLVVATGTEVFAKVDAVTLPDRIMLSEPVDRDGRHVTPLRSGSELRVAWTSPAGRHEVAATIAGVVHERVTLWQVECRTAATVVQRRDFVRVADSLRGEIHYGEHCSKLVVLDLSEGGARCVVREPRPLEVGAQVELRVTIADQDLRLPATVLAADPQDKLDMLQVRLRFIELSRATADLVRKRVLEQQRKARLSDRG